MGWWNYPRARPKPKALPGMKRKQFGETWWGQRFLMWVETISDPARLARGRSYARAGTVKEYKISDGEVAASVEGSSLYNVRISLKKLKKAQWSGVMGVMKGKALFRARFLSGDLPEELEKVFSEAGVPLFPTAKDVKTLCSCPDWANPCKHIAAVFYIIADAFDHDPFLILQLRGMDRGSIAKELKAQEEEKPAETACAMPVEKPIEYVAASYFNASRPLDEFSFGFKKPAVSNCIMKRLRKPKFWDSNAQFDEEWARIYSEIAKHARKQAFAGGGV